MLYERSIPENEKLFDTAQLPMDKSILDNENIRWFEHPIYPVSVNEDGTHLRLDTRNCLIPIRKHVYRKNGWINVYARLWGLPIQKKVYRNDGTVDVRLTSSKSKTVCFGNLALECFDNKLLGRGYMSDHIDGNRLNNSRSNLRPATSLLNGDNSVHPVSKDTNTPGVRLVRHRVTGEPRYYQASVQIYTPDESTKSANHLEYFSIKALGNEEAFRKAKEYRFRHMGPRRNECTPDHTGSSAVAPE